LKHVRYRRQVDHRKVTAETTTQKLARALKPFPGVGVFFAAEDQGRLETTTQKLARALKHYRLGSYASSGTARDNHSKARQSIET
jgi:hypothetical protein